MTTHHRSAVRVWLLIAAMTVTTHGLLILALIVAVAVAWTFDVWLILGFVAAGLIFLAAERILGSRSSGWIVRPGDEPDLVGLIEGVAASTGFDDALIVRVMPSPDASLGYERVEGTGAFVLELGWPYVSTLSRDQLSAVVAHELTHAGDLRARGDRGLVAARNSLAAAGFAIPIISGLLLLASRTHALDTELAADVAAADAVGPQHVVDALARTAQIDELWDTLVEHWTETMVETGEFPTDVYSCATQALEDPEVVAWLNDNVEREIVLPDPAATHPTRAERIHRVGLSPRALRHDPAVTIHRRDAIQNWCLRDVFDPDQSGLRPGTIKGSPPGRFDHDPAQALSEIRSIGGDVNTRIAMDHFVDRIENGTWRELAQHLDPDIADLPPEVAGAAEQAIMVSCLGTALIVPLLTAGWHRASPWLNHVVESPEGSRIDVYVVVDQCLRTGDGTTLRTLIASAALVPA